MPLISVLLLHCSNACLLMRISFRLQASSTSPVISNISIGDTFVTHSLAVSFGSGLPTYSFASICLADVTYRADVAPGFAVAATEGSGRCYVLVRGADLAADPMATQLLAYENSTQMCELVSGP